MKKLTFLGVCLFLAFQPFTGQAQSMKSKASSILGNVFSSVSSSNSSKTSTASSIFNFLTGTKNVSAANLVGNWSYSEPAAAFESKNLLSQAGGALMANQIQKQSGNYLTKYGIKPGSVTFNFKNDSTFTAKVGQKTVNGTYLVKGSNVELYKAGVKALTANVNMKSSNMQLTFKADKLLSLIKMLNYVPTTSGSTGTALKLISKLSNTYDGMQVGMQFSKK